MYISHSSYTSNVQNVMENFVYKMDLMNYNLLFGKKKNVFKAFSWEL